ncbi:MAG: polymerase subunit gamma/tau, partial [Belnapia sp.]|nr:polymerase subunit gamma/tau [Belnapia sp.]
GPAPAGGGGGGGGLRATANGGAVLADAVAAEGQAQPQHWRDVVALASGRRAMLHAHLVHSVHPVRVTPGRIELRVLPGAPRDLAAELSGLLAERTGQRWTIALTNAEGEPTLAQQGRTADTERRGLAQSHPLVQAVLAAFPGATIESVRDASADAYGLVDAGPADFAAPAPAEPEDAAGISDESEPTDYDDVPPPDDDR